MHADRLVHKLIPLSDQQRQDQARVRGQILELYADLKAYRRDPDPALAPNLTARFDAIFTQRTAFAILNQTLKRLHAHKEKLLLVLKRPEIVLHTNGSEGDIRGHVKWRKISGGTRSELGKPCVVPVRWAPDSRPSTYRTHALASLATSISPAAACRCMVHRATRPRYRLVAGEPGRVGWLGLPIVMN